tara:strand:- start:1109 stop:2131 length:1023 start_codon:yes stop_codon:yes gene_type:complete
MAWASQQGSVLPTSLDTGNWFVDQSGSWSCKTDFKSRVKVVAPDGKELKYTNQTKDGDKTLTFDKVVQGSTIEWEIETLADKKKGASDRATVELTYLDTQYLALLVNKVLGELSESDKQKVVAGDTTPLEPLMERYLDIELAIVSIYSDTVTTDSNGKASGKIPIEARWPDAAYTLTAHYGYSDLGEGTTDAKASKFIWEDVAPFVIEIGLVIIASVLTAGVASGWAAGLLVAARAAKAGAVIAAVVDAAILTKQYFIEGFGVIDQNKYGCSFPIVGFNHTYGFNVSFEEAIQESGSLLTNLTDNPELQNEYMNQLYDNFIGYSVAGAATVGILLWILFS